MDLLLHVYYKYKFKNKSVLDVREGTDYDFRQTFQLLAPKRPTLTYRPVSKIWIRTNGQEDQEDYQAVRNVVRTFICLESITLMFAEGARLDLSFCPRFDDWGWEVFPDVPRPNTLVIIWQGSSTDEWRRFCSVTTMLEQLQTGEYKYFKHLVVRVASWCRAPGQWERDLEALRAHFETVRVEGFRGFPAIPVPASCVETGSAGWVYKGALW